MRKNEIQNKIWHIILQPNTDIKPFLALKNIGHQIIRIEQVRKPTIIQCKRCQRFNHAASSCNLPYRCVKCTDSHEPGMCPTNTNNNKTKPKCVNCSGEHTANNANKCPAFKRALAAKEDKKKKKTAVTDSNTQSTSVDTTKQNKTQSEQGGPKNSNDTTASNDKKDAFKEFFTQQNSFLNDFFTNMQKMQIDFLNKLNG